MRQRSIKAFFIALILYLPIVLLFVGLQETWTPPESAGKEEERLFPIGFLTQAPAPQPVAVEQDAPPKARPQPPSAASAAEIGAVPSEEEHLTAAPKPLSAEELSAAFAPAPAPQETPEPEAKGIVPATELGDLYGLMLFELTEAERKFLADQLGPIGVITQRYLRYPALAGQLRMSGETVLAFTLLPSGDITPIEIIKSSGYSLLDDNAVHTVQIAHKDYPHPKEPVRIRMRVFYRLY